MVRRLIPIIVGLAILGIVTGIAAIMLVFLGQDWGDALFWIFAAVMIADVFGQEHSNPAGWAAFAVTFVAFWYGILYLFYRRNIILKV